MRDNTNRSTGRAQTRGEEAANTVSHAIGFIAALVAIPFLVRAALQQGATAVVGVSIFAASMALLYLSSTVYHALRDDRAKRIFQKIDHGAIYLLIAGTYTPFMLGVLRGPWGWTLLALVWTLAAAGIVFKTVAGVKFPRVSTAIYLGMGWIIVIAAKPLWVAMPGWGLFWLAAGGVAYTAGVGFYAARHMRYAHFVWHLFVIAGTACHFLAVYQYSA